jgi:hypothetical protein
MLTEKLPSFEVSVMPALVGPSYPSVRVLPWKQSMSNTLPLTPSTVPVTVSICAGSVP